MGVSPLRGPNDPRFAERFPGFGKRCPDMTAVYDGEYRDVAFAEAREMGLELQEGVYAALSGPTYETPAEIRMLRGLGADAVGMSTVPEALVARHMGLRVLGISCITNMAAGVLDQPIDHDEVMETGALVSGPFGELLRRVIPRLA
jgi:purine-nucleoside phosphorylase